MAGTDGFAGWIDMERDARPLGPECSVCFGVKEPEVGNEMLEVVRGQLVGRRCLISNVGIERGLVHDVILAVANDSTLRIRRSASYSGLLRAPHGALGRPPVMTL
jgi:hypothetical protein